MVLCKRHQRHVVGPALLRDQGAGGALCARPMRSGAQRNVLLTHAGKAASRVSAAAGVVCAGVSGWPSGAGALGASVQWQLVSFAVPFRFLMIPCGCRTNVGYTTQSLFLLTSNSQHLRATEGLVLWEGVGAVQQEPALPPCTKVPP